MKTCFDMKPANDNFNIPLLFILVMVLLCSACAPQSTIPEQMPITIPETVPLPDSPTMEITAENYFEQGIVTARNGQYEQAIQDVTRSLEINPLSAEAYYLRGIAYLGEKESALAIKDLDRATALGIMGQEVPGLKEIIDSIVPTGELILLDITCTSEGGIDCRGNPKPYTNTVHLQLFANPGEPGIEIDTIHISPAISAKSQVKSPIKYFHNIGIEHLIICISSTKPPTTPPTCSVDYKPRDNLSFIRSNKITCAEIEVDRLICPRQSK
jgi:hypothetical protein